jgi:hypothetical protein
MSVQASPEQRQCMEYFNDGGSLKVEARAGTGKTTTLRYLSYRGDMYGKALYTTFGKKNCQDARTKFPSNRVAVLTNHALAYRSFGTSWRNQGRIQGRLTPGKLATFMGWTDDTFSPFASRNSGAYLVRTTLEKFVQSCDDEISSFHAMQAIGRRPYSPFQVLTLASILIQKAREVWHRMMDRKDVMPIYEDVYLKAFALSKPQLGYKHIFLDEAQDTSDLMIGLLESQEDCQLVLVGDRWQGIYGFRGAVNAMDRFETDNTGVLNQSYRFGEQIADVANAVLACFLDTESRVLGLPSIPSRVKPIERPYCVLARTNATLIAHLAERSMKEPTARLAVVGGVKEMEDLLLGAQHLMNGQMTFVPDLAEFSSWYQVEAVIKEDGYSHLKPLVELIASYSVPGLQQVLERVKGNEGDEKACDQVFSTAHKAKGREFPTVALCDDFTDLPRTPEEREKWNPEEGNLLYVAATRAQLELDISHCTAAQHAMDLYQCTA